MITSIKYIFKSKFFKNSALYTIGSMLTPLIGFIMIPIYTNYLSPSEYGTMTTVQTLVGMFQLFLLLSLHGAVSRFYYDFLDNPNKQKEYLGSIYLFVLLFASIISIVLIVFDDYIGGFLFKNIAIKPYYYYLIGLSWISAISTLPMTLYRAQEKAGTFVIINIIKSLLIMGFSIYFIIFKGFGAESALLANLIVTVIVTIFTYIYQLKDLKLSLNMKFIKESLIFSLPLLPHVASAWIISASDRVILEKYVSLTEIGVYSLAVQIASVLNMFYSSVNQALVPRYTILRKEDKKKESKQLLKIFFYVVFISGLISIPIATVVLKIISTNDYQEAFYILPILLISQMINGFYFIPVAKLFYVKASKYIATSSIIAALLNIVGNISLIPLIGIYGAIIATLIAEAVRFILIFRYSLKVESM